MARVASRSVRTCSRASWLISPRSAQIGRTRDVPLKLRQPRLELAQSCIAGGHCRFQRRIEQARDRLACGHVFAELDRSLDQSSRDQERQRGALRRAGNAGYPDLALVLAGLHLADPYGTYDVVRHGRGRRATTSGQNGGEKDKKSEQRVSM